ncbi:hypothetical protein Hanom_Chr10g00873351 [Helianthus anomalus]
MNRPTFNLSSQIPLTFSLHPLSRTVVLGAGCSIGGRQRPTARVCHETGGTPVIQIGLFWMGI